jgi:glycosyltransferase involved in cell wall biosynthesis
MREVSVPCQCAKIRLMEKQKISVVVPVYNEADNLREAAADLKKVTSALPHEFEIIFVDDGSTDKSYEILKSLAGIIVCHHPYNLGYGAALKTGMKKAIGDWILITDADRTYDSADIPRLLETFDEYAMVVGARTGEKVKIPLARKPIKWLLGFVANVLTRTKIPDLNSGLRIFKKDVAREFLKILPNGFSFTTTITLAMLTNDYPVKYIPIDYHQRGGRSKIRPIYDAYNFFVLILRTILYFNPLRIFMPISLFFITAAVGVFIYSDFFTPKIMDQTIAVLFTTGVEVAVIGLLADLIDKRGLS